MPRAISGENEAGRHRQIGYRDRLTKAGRYEIDAVDTSLATALSMFIDTAARLGSAADRQAALHLENIAVDALYKRVLANRRKRQLPPFDPDQLGRELRERVASRLYYLKMIRLHPDSSAADKRRFAMGPAPHGLDPLVWNEELDVHLTEEPDEVPFDFDPDHYDDEA